MSDASIRERQRRAAVTGDVEDRARVYADKLRTAGPCVECAPTQNMIRNEAMRRWERRFAKGERWPQKPGMARIVTVYTDGGRVDFANTLRFYTTTKVRPRLRRVGVSHYEVVLHDADRALCAVCHGAGNPVLADLTILARAGDEAAQAVVGPLTKPAPLAAIQWILGRAPAARRRLDGK